LDRLPTDVKYYSTYRNLKFLLNPTEAFVTLEIHEDLECNVRNSQPIPQQVPKVKKCGCRKGLKISSFVVTGGEVNPTSIGTCRALPW
jgi:hypothetical protein